MRSCLFSLRQFFWVLGTRYQYATAPILTINMSKDVVSRKDVPFGVPKTHFLHFDPIFAKTQIFGRFSTGLRKIRLKTGFNMGTSSVNTPCNDRLLWKLMMNSQIDFYKSKFLPRKYRVTIHSAHTRWIPPRK